MAALPQFMPEGSPGEAVKAGLTAETTQQSWMNSAQERALRAAQEQRTQQQFLAALPAFQAKAQADAAASQNEIASIAAQQQIRGQWQTMKPQVIADIAAINDPANQKLSEDGTPDWEAKYHAYEALQAKYAGLAMLPEGKAYYDMLDQGKKMAFDSAMKHTMAEFQLQRMQGMLEGRLQSTLTSQTHQAELNAATKPSIAQELANNQLRNNAFTDISAQRGALGQTNAFIESLAQDLKAEQGPSGKGSGPIVGSKVASYFRPSVQQVNKDIGDFANRIMSTVKNIRNVQEFKAVTAQIPTADVDSTVQNRQIDKLRTMTQTLIKRNNLKEQLLRADPKLTPDEADAQVDATIPFDLSGLSSNAAGQQTDSTPTTSGRFKIIEVK